MNNIDKLKEHIIGSLSKMKQEQNKVLDETIRLVDNLDNIVELMEAMKNSPLVDVVKVGLKEKGLHNKLNNLESVEDMLIDLGKKSLNENTTQQYQYAYDMGFDCGKNGANHKNSHFGLFHDEDSKNAWEKGVKAGKLSK